VKVLLVTDLIAEFLVILVISAIFPVLHSTKLRITEEKIHPALSFGSPEEKKVVDTQRPSSAEDRAAALMAYRKAKGLCYKCGLKWQHGHKCANSVSLHMVEELWQLVQSPNPMEGFSQDNPKDSDSSDDLMTLSAHAVQGTEAPRTLRLVGKFYATEVVMLVDSGSTHNFVSESLAGQWLNWSPLSTPLQVRIANGNIPVCTHELLNCPICVEGYCFLVNLRILPLHCYDIILGMDWLEQHSPMIVN